MARPEAGGGGASTHGTGKQLNDWADRWNHVFKEPRPEPRKQYSASTPTQWGAPLKPKPREEVGYQIDYNATHKPLDPSVVGKAYVSLTDVRNADARNEEKVQRSKDRLAREIALNRDNGGPKVTVKPKVQAMSWAEYNKLTPRQRAAIDFNTMLTRAVKQDLAKQEMYENTISDQERTKYDQQTTKMFGYSGRDSEIYAPQTMALLDQIKFKDKAADLDDFLGLKTAITDEDLKHLEIPSGAPGAVSQSGFSPSRNEEITLKRELTGATMNIEAKLAAGRNMQASMQTMLQRDRAQFARQLGAEFTLPDLAVGYRPLNENPKTGAPKDKNTAFQRLFETLADKHVNIGEGLGKSRALLGADEYREFMGYANLKTNNALQFDQKLGGPGTRTASELRAALGMGKGTE